MACVSAFGERFIQGNYLLDLMDWNAVKCPTAYVTSEQQVNLHNVLNRARHCLASLGLATNALAPRAE